MKLYIIYCLTRTIQHHCYMHVMTIATHTVNTHTHTQYEHSLTHREIILICMHVYSTLSAC